MLVPVCPPCRAHPKPQVYQPEQTKRPALHLFHGSLLAACGKRSCRCARRSHFPVVDGSKALIMHHLRHWPSAPHSFQHTMLPLIDLLSEIQDLRNALGRHENSPKSVRDHVVVLLDLCALDRERLPGIHLYHPLSRALIIVTPRP